jgi:hypothetical protein
LLPGEAIVSVPQLLSFRGLVANDIATVLRYMELSYPPSTLDGALAVISEWLDKMQQLVDEIYGLIKEFHDAPITRLLAQPMDRV